MITPRDTQEVYANRWMKVREDAVTFPNGDQGIFGVVEKPDFVAVIPIDAENRIHLVEQYRYPVGERSWEIPMGAWQDRPDAPPEEVARGELKEETGFVAGDMTPVGFMHQAPGYSSQGCHLFVARDLTRGATEREASESDMITRSFSGGELRQMILEGQIKDSTTIAAFAYLMLDPSYAGLFP